MIGRVVVARKRFVNIPRLVAVCTKAHVMAEDIVEFAYHSMLPYSIERSVAETAKIICVYKCPPSLFS